MDNCFYEMVKKWTVNDYKTPGIKAEVILDMLISEFVENLIRYYFSEQSIDVDVTLLAKEFPIRTNEENYLNAKVDYLVSVGNDKLLLVELKITNESISIPQKERMEKAISSGAKELIKFYYDICNLKSGNSLDSQKYKYSRAKFDEKARLDGISSVDYLYILLTDDNRLKDKKLVLVDYCKNKKFKDTLKKDKKELWDKVSEILLECANNT